MGFYWGTNRVAIGITIRHGKLGNHENSFLWLLRQQISPKLGPIEAQRMSRPFKADDSPAKKQEKTRPWTNLSIHEMKSKKGYNKGAAGISKGKDKGD